MIAIQFEVNIKDGKGAEALDILRRERKMATGSTGFCKDLLIWQRLSGMWNQLVVTYVLESLTAWDELSLPDEYKALIEEGWQYMDRRINANILKLVD